MHSLRRLEKKMRTATVRSHDDAMGPSESRARTLQTCEWSLTYVVTILQPRLYAHPRHLVDNTASLLDCPQVPEALRVSVRDCYMPVSRDDDGDACERPSG